jgi:hypothetical protein
MAVPHEGIYNQFSPEAVDLSPPKTNGFSEQVSNPVLVYEKTPKQE